MKCVVGFGIRTVAIAGSVSPLMAIAVFVELESAPCVVTEGRDRFDMTKFTVADSQRRRCKAEQFFNAGSRQMLIVPLRISRHKRRERRFTDHPLDFLD